MKYISTTRLLFFTATLFVLPFHAQTSQDYYSQQELKQCISYHKTMEKRKGNVSKLADIMDEIDGKIRYYDRKLDDLEGQINYSSGSQRNSMIDQYDYLLAKRNDYSDLYNQALNKQQLRISQFNSTAERYKSKCFGRSAKIGDLDLICPKKRGILRNVPIAWSPHRVVRAKLMPRFRQFPEKAALRQ